MSENEFGNTAAQPIAFLGMPEMAVQPKILALVHISHDILQARGELYP
ncbi:MAG: hypothetical protein ACJ8R9_25625 [Steroidobacteraceae bacterium]